MRIMILINHCVSLMKDMITTNCVFFFFFLIWHIIVSKTKERGKGNNT